MQLDETQIKNIVKRVAERLSQSGPAAQSSIPAQSNIQPTGIPPANSPKRCSGKINTASSGGFADIDKAVEAAGCSQQKLDALSLGTRGNIIASMRKAAIEHSAALAKLCIEETKRGRYQDKLNKNLLAASKTPGVEILQPKAYT